MITERNISQYKPTGKYSCIESTSSTDSIGDCRIIEACTHGMECLMLLERRVPDRSDDYESTGNLLLDDIYIFAVCDTLKKEGKNPFISSPPVPWNMSWPSIMLNEFEE